MKTIKQILLFFIFVALRMSVTAQGTSSTVISSSDIKVFVSGECMEIHLPDSCDYERWSEVQQRALIEQYHLKNKDIKRFVIRCRYLRDIWIYGNSSLIQLSSTDIRDFDPFKTQKYTNAEYSKYDFFNYYGVAMDIWQSHFSLSVSSRFGCFFFKRLLDVSINLSYSFISEQSFGSSALSISLMSKVHPFYKSNLMRKYRLSPYIGLEGGYYATFFQNERTDSWNINGLIGLSWQIGPGSLDFGIQSGKQEYFAATIGYSFCPAMLSQYKKTKKQ